MMRLAPRHTIGPLDVKRLALSPDARLLAWGSGQTEVAYGVITGPSTVGVIDVEHGKSLWRSDAAHADDVLDLAMSPDGEILASCDGLSIELFSARTGEQRKTITTGARAMTFLEDGSLVIAAPRGITWMGPDGISRAHVAVDGVTALLSLGATTIAFGTVHGGIGLVGAEGSPRWIQPDAQAQARIHALASAGTKLVCVSRAPADIELWDLEARTRIGTLSTMSWPAESLAWLFGPRVLVAGSYGGVFAWDLGAEGSRGRGTQRLVQEVAPVLSIGGDRTVAYARTTRGEIVIATLLEC